MCCCLAIVIACLLTLVISAEPLRVEYIGVVIDRPVEIYEDTADGIELHLENVELLDYLYLNGVRVKSIVMKNVVCNEVSPFMFDTIQLLEGAVVDVSNLYMKTTSKSSWGHPLEFIVTSIGDNVRISVRDSFLLVEKDGGKFGPQTAAPEPAADSELAIKSLESDLLVMKSESSKMVLADASLFTKFAAVKNGYESTRVNAGFLLWAGEYPRSRVTANNLTVEISNTTFYTGVISQQQLMDNSGAWMSDIICTACSLSVTDCAFTVGTNSGHSAFVGLGKTGAFIDSLINIERNSGKGRHEGPMARDLVSFNFKGPMVNNSIAFLGNLVEANTTEDTNARQFAINLLVGDIFYVRSPMPFYNNTVVASGNTLAANNPNGCAVNILLFGNTYAVPEGLVGATFDVQNNLMMATGADYVGNIGVASFTTARGVVANNELAASMGSKTINIGLHVFQNTNTDGIDNFIADRYLIMVEKAISWDALVLNNTMHMLPWRSASAGVVAGTPYCSFTNSVIRVLGNKLSTAEQPQPTFKAMYTAVKESSTVIKGEVKYADTYTKAETVSKLDTAAKLDGFSKRHSFHSLQEMLRAASLDSGMEAFIKVKFEMKVVVKGFRHSGAGFGLFDSSVLEVIGNQFDVLSTDYDVVGIELMNPSFSNSRALITDNGITVASTWATAVGITLGDISNSAVDVSRNTVRVQGLDEGARVAGIAQHADFRLNIHTRTWVGSVIVIADNTIEATTADAVALGIGLARDSWSWVPDIDLDSTSFNVTGNVLNVTTSGNPLNGYQPTASGISFTGYGFLSTGLVFNDNTIDVLSQIDAATGVTLSFWDPFEFIRMHRTRVRAQGETQTTALYLETYDVPTVDIAHSAFISTQNAMSAFNTVDDGYLTTAMDLYVYGPSPLHITMAGVEIVADGHLTEVHPLILYNVGSPVTTDMLVGTSIVGLSQAPLPTPSGSGCVLVRDDGYQELRMFALNIAGATMSCREDAILFDDSITSIIDSNVEVRTSKISVAEAIIASEANITNTSVAVVRNEFVSPSYIDIDNGRRKLLSVPRRGGMIVWLPYFTFSDPRVAFVVQCNRVNGRFVLRMFGPPSGTTFLDCTVTPTLSTSRTLSRPKTPTRDFSRSATTTLLPKPTAAPSTPRPSAPATPVPLAAIAGGIGIGRPLLPLNPGSCERVTLQFTNKGGLPTGSVEFFIMAIGAHVSQWGFSGGNGLCREVNGSQFVARNITDSVKPDSVFFICSQPTNFALGAEHSFWLDVVAQTNPEVTIDRTERTLVAADRSAFLATDSTALLKAKLRGARNQLRVSGPSQMRFTGHVVVSPLRASPSESINATSALIGVIAVGEQQISLGTGEFAIDSIEPSVRQACKRGTVVTMTGTNLQNLPPAVAYGPLFLPVTAEPGGRRATFVVPDRIVVPDDLRAATVPEMLLKLQSKDAMLKFMRSNIESTTATRCALSYFDMLTLEAPTLVEPLIHLINASLALPPAASGSTIHPTPLDVTDIASLCAFVPSGGGRPLPAPEIVIDEGTPTTTTATPEGATVFVTTCTNTMHATSPLTAPPTATVTPISGIATVSNVTLISHANGSYTFSLVLVGDNSVSALLVYNFTITTQFTSTTRTITIVRTVPQLQVRMRRTARFSGDIEVSVITPAVARDVFVRLWAVDPPVPVSLKSRDSRCTWNPTTFTMQCALADMDGRTNPNTANSNGSTAVTTALRRSAHLAADAVTGVYLIGFEADIASYFSQPLTIRAEAEALNALPTASSVRIAPVDRDPADNSFDSAPEPPGGALGGDLSDPLLLGTPAPDEPVVATTAPRDPSMSTALRSIFQPDGCLGRVNFLFVTCVVYAALLLVRQLYHMIRRRRDGRIGMLRIPTHNVGKWTALLPLHAWIAVVAPHHHHSAMLQLTITFVHVLAFYAFGSTLYNAFGVTFADPIARALALGGFTAMLATAVQPLSHFMYMMHFVEDKRREALSGGLYRVAGMFVTTHEHEMAAFGFRHVERIAVSGATMSALNELSSADPAAMAMSPVMLPPAAADPSFVAQPPLNDCAVFDEAELVVVEHRDSELFVDSDKTPAAFDPAPASTAVELSTQSPPLGSVQAPREIADLSGQRRFDPATHVKVISGKHRRTAHLINFVMALIFGVWTVLNTRSWCRTEAAHFLQICVAALVVDAVLVQPLFIATTCMYRWMAKDDEGPMVFDTYPIDGQLRFIGLPYDDTDEVDALKSPPSAANHDELVSKDVACAAAAAASSKGAIGVTVGDEVTMLDSRQHCNKDVIGDEDTISVHSEEL